MPARIYYEDKICQQCGKNFNRNTLPSGRLEAFEDFKIRKYCSHKCYSLFNSGIRHYNYIRGYRLSSEGYARDSRDVFIHRKIIEQHLGRKLEKFEHVHHIDGNKLNNSMENLQITENSQHRKLHVKFQKRNEKGMFIK